MCLSNWSKEQKNCTPFCVCWIRKPICVSRKLLCTSSLQNYTGTEKLSEMKQNLPLFFRYFPQCPDQSNDDLIVDNVQDITDRVYRRSAFVKEQEEKWNFEHNESIENLDFPKFHFERLTKVLLEMYFRFALCLRVMCICLERRIWPLKWRRREMWDFT